MVDQNNIEDQEAGRMSKWGSWWDGFGDSYRSNIFDKWETWLAMVFLGGMFVFILTKSPAEAEKTNIVETSRPTPTAPFVSTAKPKSQSSTHSRKTASNKVRPTHHKSAASKQSSH